MAPVRRLQLCSRWLKRRKVHGYSICKAGEVLLNLLPTKYSGLIMMAQYFLVINKIKPFL